MSNFLRYWAYALAALLAVLGSLAVAGAAEPTYPVPPGPIVTASPPKSPTPGGAPPPPAATPLPGSSPIATPPRVENTPVAATPTPMCGTLEKPCYTKVQLPVVYEDRGGVMIGLMIVYAISALFTKAFVRSILAVALLVAICLSVLTGAQAYLWGWLLFVVAVVAPDGLRNIVTGAGGNWRA